ncbi:cytochrome p450 [Moniliophthora roreri MCA 2997]|uniref:Cytochrome p450 n=1 Tax=Moniliophthora roreri (strain MCA 2997) TaxID=1381753 RepID=V2XSA8_MONRO|nr:cytochrome p450 [Moniliophthora roreri MCA 2997]
MTVIVYTLIIICVTLVIVYAISRRSRSDFSFLPGPPSPSFVYGHSLDIAQSPVGTRYNVWQEVYGPTFPLKGPFGRSVLVVGDPKGANYILQGTNFERSASDKAVLELFFGRGLFCAEGDEHQRMRGTLSGSFSNQSIQEITPVFVHLAERLVDYWEKKLDSTSHATFDVTADIHRLTFDAITMTMLAHDLSSTGSDIPTLLRNITHSPPDDGLDILLRLFAEMFPAILSMPSSMKTWCANLRKSLGSVARKVWLEREHGAGMHAKLLDDLAKEHVPEDVVITQIIGIIFAGSETTANVITECLYELARNPGIQKKLRAELVGFETMNGRMPAYDDLVKGSMLPYLDAVTQETMRLKAVSMTISRVAARDDAIPLHIPVKDRQRGTNSYTVPVQAGTLIEIPIRDGINVNRDIWGADAAVFDPERWMDPKRLPETVKWVQAQGNMLTFGDGSKVCLGRAFAIIEFKTVVSYLVRSFALEQVDGIELEFYRVGGNTIKPVIRGGGFEDTRMPLRVHRVA